MALEVLDWGFASPLNDLSGFFVEVGSHRYQDLTSDEAVQVADEWAEEQGWDPSGDTKSGSVTENTVGFWEYSRWFWYYDRL